MKREKGENSISWAKSCHCYKGNLKKIFLWGLPWHPMVKTSPSNAGVWVRSLVWELRFPLPCGQNTKTQSRSNTVTDSIKTLKMVHIQKVFKKNLCICHLHWLHKTPVPFFIFLMKQRSYNTQDLQRCEWPLECPWLMVRVPGTYDGQQLPVPVSCGITLQDRAACLRPCSSASLFPVSALLSSGGH